MSDDDGGALQGFPTIPKRRSDKTAKSGEDMMDVLVDDIIRYESLAEKEELLLMSSLVSGGVNDEFEVELEELNLPEDTNRPASPTYELYVQIQK